jgi:hypothetical protein
MSHLKSIAVAAAVAGSLGLAALGIGSGVANAAPSPTGWAQDRGWGHGRDWGRGPGWGPAYYAPPPPPVYGYGYPPPCVTGPLGLVHVCA